MMPEVPQQDPGQMPQCLWIYWVMKEYSSNSYLDINWLSAAASDTDEELGIARLPMSP